MNHVKDTNVGWGGVIMAYREVMAWKNFAVEQDGTDAFFNQCLRGDVVSRRSSIPFCR